MKGTIDRKGSGRFGQMFTEAFGYFTSSSSACLLGAVSPLEGPGRKDMGLACCSHLPSQHTRLTDNA